MLDVVHHMRVQCHKFEHRWSNFGCSPEVISFFGIKRISPLNIIDKGY